MRQQPKRMSLIEAVTSNVAGLVVTFLVQQFLYPLVGITMGTGKTVVTTLLLGAIMTVKSYGIRRLFTEIGKRMAKKRKAEARRRRRERKSAAADGASDQEHK